MIAELGPESRWHRSWRQGAKTYSVYVAAGEDISLEHARCAGIPANRMSRVTTSSIHLGE